MKLIRRILFCLLLQVLLLAAITWLAGIAAKSSLAKLSKPGKKCSANW